MKFIIGVLVTVIFTCSSSLVLAEAKKSKAQNFKELRADILSTITSINEIRLVMLNSELNRKKKKVPSVNDAKLFSNVTDNNTTIKELTKETKSNDIRLSILEKSIFSKEDNDFNEYITSSTTKKFNVKLVQSREENIECDAITDTYTYARKPDTNDGVEIIETITRLDVSGKICFKRDILKRKTATQLLYVSSQNKIYNDYPVYDIATYTKPVIVLTSSMEQGKSFGSGGIITYESNGVTNTLVFNKVSTLLDTEAEITLTVNLAEKTYLNCLIIGTRSNSTVSTEWYCPGDGLVKRIIFYPSAANKPSRSEILTLRNIEQY